MAITLKSIKSRIDPGEDTNMDAEKFIEELGDELKRRLHITVGTGNAGIAPYEARTLVEDWKKGKRKDQIISVALENVTVKGGLKGLFG
jgi:tRNA ligase